MNSFKSMKFYWCALALSFAALTAIAQSENADVSKMGHMKYRAYLKENGLKTQSGAVVKVGDELVIGKGSLPDKRYAFIYQAPTGFGSQTSMDASTKAYLNSNARGRKAVVKAFMTSGVRKGEYAVFAVVGVGELRNYWIEVDNAQEAGEITLPTK